MTRYIIALIACVLVGGFALLSAVYCAWLTATPLTPAALHHAQTGYLVWLGLFSVMVVASIVVIICMIRFHWAQRREQIKRIV
jgi:Na+-driven multidrug efflux pump